MRQSSAAYRREGGDYLIELNLRDVRQLFNSLDPAPFLEKDLDNDAEQYIVDAVRELGLRHRSKLLIHLPESGLRGEDTSSLISAIHHYFQYRARHAADNLRQTLARGAVSLVIGLAFLFVCLTLRQLAGGLKPGATGNILSEGLLIMGWVAMWRPIEIFLYDWWPIQRQQRVLIHLGRIPIEIKASPGTASLNP
jgi:hypothetical protein